MKIFINDSDQIKAVRTNDTGDETLTEIEVEDSFLQGYCDTVMKAFCYHRFHDDKGGSGVSVYPYKDFSLLESIQEQDNLREKLSENTRDLLIDSDFRLSMMEIAYSI